VRFAVSSLTLLLAQSVVATAAALGPAPATPFPTTPERWHRPPSFDLVAHQPSLVHRLADARGKVSVLVDLDAAQLPPGPTRARFREVAPGIGSATVDEADVPVFFSRFGDLHPWLAPPLHASMDRSGKLWTRTAEVHETGRRGQGVLVGIIDTGLDVAHPDLRHPDSGKTRVAWLLDFSRKPTGVHAALEEAFGCNGDNGPCAVFARDEIDAELAAATRSRDLVGHGTHVASLAAGNGGKKGTYVGGAPEADLVVARITRGSGDALSETDLLDAVRFVFDRADALGKPIVANVSLGGDFGPHDGTSLLERGLASFVGPNKQGHAVVVAAGNSGGLCLKDGEAYGIHTETRVVEGATARVPLRSPTVDPQSPSIDGGTFVWINVGASDDLRVGIEWNGRTLIKPIERGHQTAIQADPAAGFPYMAIINGVVGGNSPIQAGSYGAVVIIDGVSQATDDFQIHLEGHGLAQLWVQGTGEAATDGSCGGRVFAGAVKQGTISVPATHPALLAVGCTLNRTDWPTADGTVEIQSLGGLKDPTGDSACYFSGAGPSALGVAKPEIAAPGAFVVGAMSADAAPTTNTQSMFNAPKGTCDGRTCYVVDSGHGIASGTSMSAPQTSGVVALLLEAEPSLTQPEIVALLQGGARRFQGTIPYDFQLGPGALDAVGALSALAERGAPRHLVPAVAASWLQLGEAFARPSAAFAVPGFLLVRAADGDIADGFDEAPLGLTVENGFVSRELTRQAPGVWSFAVSANANTGGERLRVVARYGDTVLADRSLPISPDAANLTAFPRAEGGCAVGGGAASSAHNIWQSLSFLAIAATLFRGAHRSAGGRRSSRRAARTAPRPNERDPAGPPPRR
jgi:subtilisin family serine protease